MSVRSIARMAAVLVVAATTASCGGARGGGAAAPTISVGPNQGPPGAQVGITASGFPASVAVEIGFGPPASEYDVVRTTQSDSRGNVSVQLAVPTWAEPGREYVFVVAEMDGPGRAKAVSEPFRVTAR